MNPNWDAKTVATIGSLIPVTTAGCTGGGETEEPKEETEEVEPARFEFQEITPQDKEVIWGDALEGKATIVNTGGEEATQDIEYRVADQFNETNQATLEEDEEKQVILRINTLKLEEGKYDYGFSSDNDEISTTFSVSVIRINDQLDIDEEDLSVKVIDSGRFSSGTSTDADGIFQSYAMEIENIGREEVSIEEDQFKLGYDDHIVVEPDSELSWDLEYGVTSSESLNPGVTTTVAFGFDIPEDATPRYLKTKAGGGFLDSPKQYYINVESDE